jgi:hypothetical protein
MSIAVTGTASNPTIALTSTPSLPQDELMARVLFGDRWAALAAAGGAAGLLAQCAARGKGGLNPLGALQSAAGSAVCACWAPMRRRGVKPRWRREIHHQQHLCRGHHRHARLYRHPA